MLIRIIISFIAMLSLDFLWIGVIAKNTYFKAYGHILRLEKGHLMPIWWSAAIVYLALIFGVHYFGLSMAKYSMMQAIVHSAIFGLITYAVYDFTCLALFKDWPIGVTVIDCLWGGVLCGLTAFLTLWLEKWV